MEYQVLKVYNNNVILASQDSNQVILVSKGIGFGKKPGDQIAGDGTIEKVFHEINPTIVGDLTPVTSDKSGQIEEITHEIIEIAQVKLGSLNENLHKALFEHIEFAIERLKIGLTIENPFLDEIISIYPKEYEVADIAGKLIDEQLGIEIGEEEKGFIALHLYSGRSNKSINETMKITRVYKKVIEIVEQQYQMKLNLKASQTKEFIRQLKTYIRLAKRGKKLSLPIDQAIRSSFCNSYAAAQEIAQYIKQEKDVVFSKDMIGYLAIDIEKMTQLTQQ